MRELEEPELEEAAAGAYHAEAEEAVAGFDDMPDDEALMREFDELTRTDAEAEEAAAGPDDMMSDEEQMREPRELAEDPQADTADPQAGIEDLQAGIEDLQAGIEDHQADLLKQAEEIQRKQLEQQDITDADDGVASSVRLDSVTSFLWIDIFAVAQCSHTDEARRNNKADVASFDRVIDAAGKTCMLAVPWNNPAAFCRLWCLYEAWLTTRKGKPLSLIVPQGFDLSTVAELPRVCAEEAQVGSDDDRKRILGKIRETFESTEEFDNELSFVFMVSRHAFHARNEQIEFTLLTSADLGVRPTNPCCTAYRAADVAFCVPGQHNLPRRASGAQHYGP